MRPAGFFGVGRQEPFVAPDELAYPGSMRVPGQFRNVAAVNKQRSLFSLCQRNAITMMISASQHEMQLGVLHAGATLLDHDHLALSPRPLHQYMYFILHCNG